MKAPKTRAKDELRPEYKPEDFVKLERGKYAGRLRTSSNVVVIDPDLTEFFPNAEAVNEALRSLSSIEKRAGGGQRVRTRR